MAATSIHSHDGRTRADTYFGRFDPVTVRTFRAVVKSWEFWVTVGAALALYLAIIFHS